ncbi:hypothetical protein EVAR_50396_1 [Eumeta japonica]|uniref:Reverse transcriptase domain-containing protein n=1 Tax=Eumeta variegata TaxID=151549 RepID=A0A4C1WWD8_EUMVA|nr:hypothetical protein EVAR_50396_1 [Eumeta japonica]
MPPLDSTLRRRGAVWRPAPGGLPRRHWYGRRGVQGLSSPPRDGGRRGGGAESYNREAAWVFCRGAGKFAKSRRVGHAFLAATDAIRFPFGLASARTLSDPVCDQTFDTAWICVAACPRRGLSTVTPSFRLGTKRGLEKSVLVLRMCDKIDNACELMKDRRMDILYVNEIKGKGSGGVIECGSFDAYCSGVDQSQRVCRGYECGLRMDELSFKCLLYTDDQVILAPSVYRQQETVNKMNDSVKKRDIKTIARNVIELIAFDLSVHGKDRPLAYGVTRHKKNEKAPSQARLPSDSNLDVIRHVIRRQSGLKAPIHDINGERYALRRARRLGDVVGEGPRPHPLPPGKTINLNLYCQQLMRLKQELEKKEAEFINRKGVIFHDDNAIPHMRVFAIVRLLAAYVQNYETVSTERQPCACVAVCTTHDSWHSTLYSGQWTVSQRRRKNQMGRKRDSYEPGAILNELFVISMKGAPRARPEERDFICDIVPKWVYSINVIHVSRYDGRSKIPDWRSGEGLEAIVKFTF